MEGTASFEEAERVARALMDALNRRDLDGAEALLAEDIEYVSREGPAHGRHVLRDQWEPQLERFEINFETERVVDAGEGRVILLQKVDRLDRGTGELELRAWPAVVFRVEGGEVVFAEGYQDRRKAFTDLGLEPS